jgi:hypothetical protein
VELIECQRIRQYIHHPQLLLHQIVKVPSKVMGKQKKITQNIVKVDLGDLLFTKDESLPVLIQHLSEDGCRVRQTVHQIAVPPLNPPSLGFDPCPVATEDEDVVFFDIEPLSGVNLGDCVCPCFLHFLSGLNYPAYWWFSRGLVGGVTGV